MSSRLAHLVSSNVSITKASLFLKPVGESTPCDLTNNVVLDATNFSRLHRGTLNVHFLNDSDFTDAGYLKFLGTGSSDISYDVINCPSIRMLLWLRVKTTSGTSCSLDVKVDGYVVSSLSTTISTSWSWVSVSFTIPDINRHELSITPKVGNLCLDKVCIYQAVGSGLVTPSGSGPSSTATFTTIHTRVFNTTSSLPSAYNGKYGEICSLDMSKDDWYDFDLNQTSFSSTTSAQAIVVNVSGASDNRYVLWENSNGTSADLYSTDNGATWHATTLPFACKVFKNATPTSAGPCTIEIPPAELTTISVDTFNDSSISPVLNNTVVVEEEYGQYVTLDQSDRLVTFITDESGSMSWSDREGVRHDLIQSVADRLNTGYNGTVNYNLFKIQSSPLFPLAIPLRTQIKSNQMNDVVKESLLTNSADFSGIRVLRKKGSYSLTPIDGEIINDGYFKAALDTDLEEGTEYFYTVYTYDQYGRFSKGVQISATPRSRPIPSGIVNLKSSVQIGSGVTRDDNTVAIWHCSEGSGTNVFDFSDSNIVIKGTSFAWTQKLEAQIGKSSIHLDGLTNNLSSASVTIPNLDKSVTFMTWVKPYSTEDEVILSQSQTGDLNFAIVKTGLTVGIVYDSIIYYPSILPAGDDLILNEWNHIAVIIDNAKVIIYINGVAGPQYEPAGPPGGSFPLNWGSLPINIGHTAYGFNSYGKYFGLIQEVSIHNVARDATYIQSAANMAGDEDNGDRLAVLHYSVPDDYDYVGGSYRVVMNELSSPQHENDGIVVYETSASSGNYDLAVPFKYTLLHEYFFRTFTRNSIGNWSDSEDSGLISVGIPDIPRQTELSDTGQSVTLGPGFGSTPSPTIIVQRAGNEKVHLRWTLTADPETTFIVVYRGVVTAENPVTGEPAHTYPYVKDQYIVGEVIHVGLPTETEFVDRYLSNGQPQYYAIVTIDKLTRFSSLATAKATPYAVADDSGIPLLEANNVHYRINDYDRVEILLDPPVIPPNTVNGYFDENIYFYATLSDYYGSPIPIDYPEKFTITATLVGSSVESIEDAFQLGIDTSNLKNLANISFHVNSSGLILGTLKLSNDPALAIVDSLTFQVNIVYKVSDKFQYTLPVMSCTLSCPISLELINKNNSMVSVPCDPPPNSTATIGSKSVDGGYILRKSPFDLRSVFAFKGEAIKSASADVKIFNATDTFTGTASDCHATPKLPYTTNTIRLLTTQLTPHLQTLDVLDGEGNPTGLTTATSYIDMSLSIPSIAQKGVIFVKVVYGGYTIVRKMNLFFLNILNIALTAHAPTPNGIDVREQFARAWLIDPDYPNDRSKDTLVPDNTVVQWTLSGPVNRPFYSLDKVPLKGVFSYTQNGTARNVYFGPIQDLKSEEDYTIKVSTVVHGLTASTSVLLKVMPIASTAYDPNNPDPFAPKILMEFPLTQNLVWADGADYAKLTISRNPLTSATRFASCFRDCVTEKVILKAGTKVTLRAEGWDILYGDVVEIVDEYTGNTTLNDANATIAEDEALVPLANAEYTYVFFRTNRVVKNEKTNANFPGSCDLCQHDTLEGINAPTDIVVGSTKVIYNGQPITMVGGGGGDGIPPTVLTPLNPFAMKLIGVKANDVFVEQIIIDGVTENQVIVELTWKNGPVPNGTPVHINGFFSGKTITLPKTITTLTENRTDINPTGPERSFAVLTIPAMSPDTTFYAGIVFDANYNAIGTVDRTIKIGITFGFQINQPPKPVTPSKIVSNKLERINVGTCAITNLSPMLEARSGFALEDVSGKLYAIGGTDASVIKYSCESYNIATDTWTSIADMNTARTFAQSCVASGKIYQLGGLVLDSTTNNTVVSNSVEVYNPNTNIWTTLSPMPSPVVFGVAKVVGTHIYVLSGYTDTQYTFNDRVLIYNIGTNIWTQGPVLTGDVLSRFQLASPFSYVEGTDIYVTGGYHFEKGRPADRENHIPATPDISIYPTTAYKYDTLTGITSSAEYNFRNIIVPRQRGATVSFSTDHYLIGGSNETSNSLRIIEKYSLPSPSDPYTYTKSSCKLVPGRSSFGAAVDSGYANYIYVAGGITSGRDENFLHINVESLPPSVRLQGISTAALNVSVQDENGEYPTSVDVQVTGYLDLDGTFPTLFRNDKITIHNGRGVATLYPRSDDITSKDSSPLQMQSGTLRSYTISAQASIIDSTYSGETDTDLAPTSVTPADSTSSNVQPIDLGSITVKSYPTVTYFEKSDIGGVINSSLSGLFSLTPTSFPSGNSAVFHYYSDFNWIPQIKPVINDNEGTYSRLSDEIVRLRNNVPFGASPIFDAVDAASTTMSIDNTGRKKILYIISDGDENGSTVTLEEAVNGLQQVDGSQSVPTVSAYVNVIPSAMNLSKGRRVMSSDMSQIAEANSGSSFDVTSDLDIPATVDYIISGGQGCIGYGTYECIVNLNEISPLASASSTFTLPYDAAGSWNISVSSDGLIYQDYTDILLPNTTWELNNKEAQYVKFNAVLKTNFDLSDYGQDIPSLTGLSFIYNKSVTSYIYLTPTTPDDYVHQISVTMDTTLPPLSSINVGATTSESTDWGYFFNDSQGLVSQNGKIIVPVRRKVADNSSIEPLDQVDSFAFKARYGSWDAASTVNVLDANGKSVDSSMYSTSPNLGYIIFNTKQSGISYSLSITNPINIVIGAKLTNKLAAEPILIRGAGYMWTTTKARDTITSAFLQAFNLSLLPFNPTENSVFTATYAFFDSTGREENTEKTQIKWYKIGFDNKNEHLDVLDDILTWDNKTYNLLQPGESLYFTVRPSNGTQYGAVIKSLVSTVSSDSSIRATNLQLLPTNPTPDSTFVAIYDYSNTAGKAESGTQIRWYKNGNLVPSLNDLTTFNNNPQNTGDPTASLVARDTIFFTVRPSDGASFGALVKSPVLTVSSS